MIPVRSSITVPAFKNVLTLLTPNKYGMPNVKRAVSKGPKQSTLKARRTFKGMVSPM
jgi:hypothetical protein